MLIEENPTNCQKSYKDTALQVKTCKVLASPNKPLLSNCYDQTMSWRLRINKIRESLSLMNLIKFKGYGWCPKKVTPSAGGTNMKILKDG